MLALQLMLLAGVLSHVCGSTYGSANGDLGSIIFSTVLFRHGDRSPTQSYPTDPYNDVKKYWPRGFGQLSQLGEQQQYKLGQFLRRRYSHLLPATYNANDTYVRSTDVDRTLASALCNLAGLYPQTDNTRGIAFQAVPVHTESAINDKLLQPASSCKRYSSLLSLVKQSAEYQCVNNTMTLMQKQVAQLTGFSTFQSITYDILYIENLYNLTLPAWTKLYFPSPLKELDLFEFFVTSASTTDLQRLSAGPLLKEIIRNMVSKMEGTLDPDRSLYMYSAHDTTLVDTLQALHVFNGMVVQYAAAVLIELREKEKLHYVTVSFKNSTHTEPHLLQLPRCNILCPLDQFVELTKDVVPDDEQRECAELLPPGIQFHIQVPAYAILPEWQHCFPNSTAKNEITHNFKK